MEVLIGIIEDYERISKNGNKCTIKNVVSFTDSLSASTYQKVLISHAIWLIRRTNPFTIRTISLDTRNKYTNVLDSLTTEYEVEKIQNNVFAEEIPDEMDHSKIINMTEFLCKNPHLGSNRLRRVIASRLIQLAPIDGINTQEATYIQQANNDAVQKCSQWLQGLNLQEMSPFEIRKSTLLGKEIEVAIELIKKEIKSSAKNNQERIGPFKLLQEITHQNKVLLTSSTHLNPSLIKISIANITDRLNQLDLFSAKTLNVFINSYQLL